MKRIMVFASIVFASDVTCANALVITDGDFSSWAFSATGTATMARESSGGNPGARLKNTTISGTTVYGLGIKSDFSMDIPLAGSAFALALDVLSGPGAFGQGQRILLLVEQASNIYAADLGITGYPLNWNILNFTGSFTETLFTQISGGGSTAPDFTGGTETRFGFAGGNSISGTLTQYYDNFHLEISPAVVPAPPAAALFGSAAFALAAMVRKRRKRNGDSGASAVR